jgi:GntR family transcriptional regulator, rspAB operon transcriptional repressor
MPRFPVQVANGEGSRVQIGLHVLERIHRPSVADSVFDELNRQILTLVLPPGTKLSEVDVAQALGVSRQPVRDAFYRLSKLGFLTIRPQRATTVSLISERSVMQARFIRTAIELETVRAACERLTESDFDALKAILDAQEGTVGAHDAERFQTLDDQFHREISERAGHGYVWDTIRENKSHMDRVRYLSLSFASERAHFEHREILAAIRARDVDAATAVMRVHLMRILDQIVQIRASHAAYFALED